MWLRDAIQSDKVVMYGMSTITRDEPFAEITTLEGVMRGNKGDWIIRGVQDELYPCRGDIFEQAYEQVGD